MEDNSAFMPRPMNRRWKEVTGRKPVTVVQPTITATATVSAAIKPPPLPIEPAEENVFAQLKRTSKTKGTPMKDSKSYACANGGTMRHGQLIGGHNNLARAGAPKKLTVPKLATGMMRVTTGDISPYHHSVAVMDEPMTTKISQGRQVGVHRGMQSREQRGANGDGFCLVSNFRAASALPPIADFRREDRHF